MTGGVTVLTLAASYVSGFEGREYIPYYDIGGRLTVCDGYAGSDIVKGKVYTDEECDFLLTQELRRATMYVDKYFKVELPIETKAAFISFTYNVGVDNLRKSTLLKLANAGDLVGACEQLSRWVYVRKTFIKGLSNRRQTERSLCLKGVL